jgi:hypothetical protein
MAEDRPDDSLETSVGTGSRSVVVTEASAEAAESTQDGSAGLPCDWEKSRSHPPEDTSLPVVGTDREDCNGQDGDDALLVRRMIQRGCRELDTDAEEVVEEDSPRGAAEVRIPRIRTREGAKDDEAVHLVTDGEAVVRLGDQSVHASHVDVQLEDGERRFGSGQNGILIARP